MNYIAEEMMGILRESEEDLAHYGMPRRSGRYPWGSGENPYQHSMDFIGRVEKLRKSGWSETPENIKKEFGMTTTQYRAYKAIASNDRRNYRILRAKSLQEDGLGATEIGKKMGLNESTVRSLLSSEIDDKSARATAAFIKKRVDEVGMVDVGTGVERELNISKEKLNQALVLLEMEGYNTFGGRVPQATNGNQMTTLRVICPPDTPYKENPETGKKTSSAIYDYENVHSLKEYISRDGGETYEKKFTYPESLDSSRLKIRYADEAGSDGVTGIQKDGVIEIRRGVADLDLGESRYAQVRIMVDGTHYLKGMAVYSDDMPDGVDVVFNTNKSSKKSMTEVLKPIKDDPDNPFGSAVKDAEQGGQYWYTDKNGKKKLGLINKCREEGDWEEWKNGLPSQFLAKQSEQLVKKQLKLAEADKNAEYDELCSLTNPTVKKYLLNKFADECDSAAVHLKAASLPGQSYHVILPINSLKENEIYAPDYENGTQLALVRYPHGGTFEIPIVTVNNKNKSGRTVIGTDTTDAVGINSKVAERLSGADFDGDTVMCIPTNNGKVKIKSTPALKGLEGFDPKTEYGPDTYTGRTIKVMSKGLTQTEMGKISNLITDMTLKGATSDELARAVRHSMVVIDANKHELDYKKSEVDNNIAALKKKYQTSIDEDGNVKVGGASTLLSRAKGQTTVEKRQGSAKVNIKGTDWYDPSRPEGALIYKTADDSTYTQYKVNKQTGEVTTKTKSRTQKSTKMAETDDAYTLLSDADNPKERAYADYANHMKALANSARKEAYTSGKITYSATAKSTYANEVKSLMNKLNTALKNAPRERQAQLQANATVAKKKASNPDMTKEDLRKTSQKALSKAREEAGSVSRSKRSIKITDKEWEAIQAGAISENKLTQILANTDVDSLRERATPKSSSTALSVSKQNQIKAMKASGYTTAEIATKLGVAKSTVTKYA